MNIRAPYISQFQPLQGYAFWLCVGVVIFFVNLVGDAKLNIPLGEILIAVGVTYAAWREMPSNNNLLTRILHVFVLMLLLNAVIVLTGVFGGQGIAEIVRSAIKYSLMFYAILIYRLLKHQDALISIVLGFMVGYAAHFAVKTGMSFVEIGYIPRSVRAETPSPALFLFLAFFFRHRLGIVSRTAFIAVAVLGVMISLSIESRGAMLAIGFSAILFLWSMLTRPLYFLTYIPLVIMPAIPATLIYMFPIAENLQVAYSTFSNIERAYLIEYAVHEIFARPFTGIGFDNFQQPFGDFFNAQTGWIVKATGPHSFYLDTGLIGGLPLLAVVIAYLGWMYRNALAKSMLGAPAVAWGLMICIMHCTFYGYTGIRRFEMLLIWLVIYYGFNREPLLNAAPRIGNK